MSIGSSADTLSNVSPWKRHTVGFETTKRRTGSFSPSINGASRFARPDAISTG
jgi:hypothetical protein